MKKKKVLRLIRKVLMQEGLIPNPYIYNPTHLISSANPYVFVPPRSVKIADVMKSSTGKAEIARALMGSHDPKGEKQ